MELIEYDNINIALIYETEQKDISIIRINIIRIIKIMDQINKEFNKHNQDKYRINILLTPLRKKFSKEEITLTPMNINSGSALSGSFVNVWRIEELEKVLIHELQHYLHFDYHVFDKYYKDVNEVIKKHFKLSDDNNKSNKSNESYNETLAAIINMCYQSSKYNVKINKIYEYEIKFLIFQSLKIIKHFNNIKSDYNILDIQFIQTTSCLSYYILKCILFFNIIDFLGFLKDNGIKCIGDNIRNYATFLDKTLSSDKIKNLNELISELDENVNKLNVKDDFLKNTLRMSAISN
jgi:hypothetical protein